MRKRSRYCKTRSSSWWCSCCDGGKNPTKSSTWGCCSNWCCTRGRKNLRTHDHGCTGCGSNRAGDGQIHRGPVRNRSCRTTGRSLGFGRSPSTPPPLGTQFSRGYPPLRQGRGRRAGVEMLDYPRAGACAGFHRGIEPCPPNPFGRPWVCLTPTVSFGGLTAPSLTAFLKLPATPGFPEVK